MKKKQILLFIFLIASALLKAASFDIIPTPKQVKYNGNVLKLKDYVIVIQTKLKQAQIAAQEINKRVVFLGGEKLRIYNDDVSPAKLKDVKLIIIGQKHENKFLKNVSLDIPKELQAYTIKMTNNHIILAGNDSIGTLYAAITFNQLLKMKIGIKIKGAEIKDWPDFKHRVVGNGSITLVWRRFGIFDKKMIFGKNPPKDAHFKCLQEYIDWLLNQKLNMVIAAKKFFPPKISKRLKTYANDRGIDLFMYDIFPFQSAGTVKENKGKPEYKNLQRSKRHKNNYVSWSRDDLLTKEAEKYSKVIKAGRYNYGYFESIDTGLTTLNYAEWNDRSSACKKRFGNDRAAADAHVINLLYKVIRKNNPDFKFVFTVYPYSPDNVMKENFPINIGFDMPKKFAEYKRRKLKAYYRKVNKLIPKDICMLYREAMRKDLKAYRSLFPKRAFDAYFEFGKDYRPIFATNPRFSKNFFFDNDGDIIFYACPFLMTQLSLNPIQTILCAEYAWNTKGPDSAYFRYYIDPLKDSSAPESIMKRFLPRACEIMWGRGGAAMLPLMNSGLYVGYMQNPEKLLASIKMRLSKAKSAIEETGTLSKVKLDILPDKFINAKGIRTQYEAVRKARQSIEKLLNQDNIKMSLFARRYVVHYFKYTSLWEAYSKVWCHYFKARELYEGGDIAHGDMEITKGINAAKNIDNVVEKTLLKVKGKTQLYKDFPAYPPEKGKWGHRNYLLTCKKFIEKFKKLEKRKSSLSKLKVLDKKAQVKYKIRNLKSFSTSKAITIDGKLSESSWKRAIPYSSFVKFEYSNPQIKFALEQTEVKIINDNKNLYIGIICHTANKHDIKAKKRKHDIGFWKTKDEDDSVEIFIDTNNDKKTYYHFAINPAASRFDAKCRVKEKAKISWNGNWQAATTVKNDKWIAEIRIPFNNFKGLATGIGINIGRQNVSGFAREWSCISILKKNFHDVKNYSTLTINR
jgi:Carbohydrate family 9 binding domain-like/Glycosyl hydrolase family 20, domain 2